MKKKAVEPRTLAIDIGGTGLKASVLDMKGEMLVERVRVDTPHPCTPEVLVEALVALVKPLPDFDRISVGFPGVIQDGVVVTAPNLGTEALRGFDLGAALTARLGQPTRCANDADVQGLAVIEGVGVEMVITLGTGFGTGLYHHGRLAPHLELAHMPFRKGQTFDQQLGDAARKRLGKKRWSRRVIEALELMRVLVNFRKLYIGGGNAGRIVEPLPDDIALVDNDAGILGGIRLWDHE
jgi:polyphosphate glucokinase